MYSTLTAPESRRNGKLFQLVMATVTRAVPRSHLRRVAPTRRPALGGGRFVAHREERDRVNIETAQATRLGNRRENQDRAAILIGDTRVLLIVADGMGGHSDGAAAAQTAVDSLSRSFKALRGGKSAAEFLSDALIDAHRAVYELGAKQPIAKRPRTTCTICLVDEGVAQWAHVGDSRVYWLRGETVAARTRDHSAVEALYQAGEISDEDMQTHPLRNYVEECLGGEPSEPRFTIAQPVELGSGDIMLLCSDGLWSALGEAEIIKQLRAEPELENGLEAVTRRAEAKTQPASDNVTAAALRWGV